MKLLYINVIEMNKGWGAEWFLNKAFLETGMETILLDYRKHRGHLVKKFLEIKNDFDALLIQRGDDFPLELIKSVNRPRFFLATELVSRRADQDRLFDSGLFSHVFVRGENCRDSLVRRGTLRSEQISVFLSSFDPEVHHPVHDIEKDIDVLFVGALKNRRKRILGELKKDFNVYVANVFGKDMTNLLNRAKIVLNIHAEEHVDTETRVFETLGCGAFLITETLGKENPFLDGKHIVEVKGLQEMKEKIAFYLKNKEARGKIASAGFNEARSKHTYVERAKQMRLIMESYIRVGDLKNIPPLDREKIRAYVFVEKIDLIKFFLEDTYTRLKHIL